MDLKQAMAIGFLAQGPITHSSRKIAEITSEIFPEICPKELSGNQIKGMDLVKEAQEKLQEWLPKYEKWSILNSPFDYDWELLSGIASVLCQLEKENLIDASSTEHALLLKSIYSQTKESDKFNWKIILKNAYESIHWNNEPSAEILSRFETISDI